MIPTRTPQILSNPVGVDFAIKQINDTLQSKIVWLDNVFGRCEKLEETEHNGASYPAIYSGNNEYIELFPDANLGNFSFFDISDNSKLNLIKNQSIGGIANFGLIIWFDFRKVYPVDHESKSLANVENEVLTVLNTMSILNSSITCDRILERAENVYNGYNLAQYRGFTTGKIKSPYRMRPFGVFRIEGTINYKNLC